MYEDLMIGLDLCARGEKTGYHDVELCGLAYSAIKNLNTQLAALQAENAELRTALSRVEAERDAAKKCIYDIETYLALGSAQYIGRTIQAWKSGAHGEA